MVGKSGKLMFLPGLESQYQGEQQTTVLGDDRAGSHAADACMKDKHKQQTGCYVDNVLYDSYVKRVFGFLKSDEPAGQAVKPKHGRSSPNANAEIVRGQRMNGRCG